MAEPSFEDALESLEKILEELEVGNLSLEDTLQKFEEGIKLSRICEKKLTKAQKKVSMLTRDEEGELKEVPFAESEKTEQSDEKQAGTGPLFDD